MTPDLIALFRRLTAGVYVVGVGDRSRFDAFTAACIMQVSYRPLLLELPAGDHRLVLGAVIDGALLRPEARPLVYSDTGNLDRSAELYPDNFESAAS